MPIESNLLSILLWDTLRTSLGLAVCVYTCVRSHVLWHRAHVQVKDISWDWLFSFCPVGSGDGITVSDLEAVPHRLNQLSKSFKLNPPPQKNTALIDKYTYLQYNDTIL